MDNFDRISPVTHFYPYLQPTRESLALKFLAQHLWDAVKREADPRHGMPDEVAWCLRAEDRLRVEGPHAPATVKRRLSSWATLHHWQGLEGPFAAPSLRAALRLAVRATQRPRMRKSQKAVTGDILAALLATCGSGSLTDRRDAALLLVAFASGGRRRSEVAGLRFEQLVEEPPVPEVLDDPASPLHPVWRSGSAGPRPPLWTTMPACFSSAGR
jgi:integrase